MKEITVEAATAESLTSCTTDRAMSETVGNRFNLKRNTRRYAAAMQHADIEPAIQTALHKLDQSQPTVSKDCITAT